MRKNMFSCFYLAKLQLTKIRNSVITILKGFLTDMLSRSITEKKLQLKQLKDKQLPSQPKFATLTQDSQITPFQILVAHEIVFSSQKDDCYPISDDFGNDHSLLLLTLKREIGKLKPFGIVHIRCCKNFLILNLKNHSINLPKRFLNSLLF